MRKIDKINEPIALANFKNAHPTLKYLDLERGFQNIRTEIRSSCIREQFFICAYCCDRINLTTCHNEHIIPQSSIPGANLTLDYVNNIVASCQSTNHCGHKKDNNPIDLTPLMIECETEIVFQLNGKMTHSSQRAQNMVNVLNLRNKALERKRKQVIDIVLFDYVSNLNDLSLEKNYYLEIIIEKLKETDADGKLEAFSPIIINVLRQFIS